MKAGSSIDQAAAFLAAAITLLGTDASAQGVDLYGVTQATLAWDAASGPVVGYYVVVTKNTEPPAVYTFSATPQATIDAAIGDELVVAVAAYDAAGIAGPVSPPSPTIRFNPAGGGSPPPPPPDDPPPDDPAPGDPLPDGPGTPLDFTGDGASDLLLRADTGELTLWRMGGSTLLGADSLPYLPPSWNVVGNGDYDGNGVADILWEETTTGRLIAWLVTGGVPFQGGMLDLTGLDPADQWKVGGSGDFDGDGTDDVMLFSRVLGASEIAYLRDGAVDSRARLPGYVGAWSVDAVADVDGDGVDEVVWRDELLHRLVLWNLDGTGTATPTELVASTAGWRVIGSGDFDGDGRADLFVQHSQPDQLQVWLLDGKGVAGSIDLPLPADGETPAGVGDYDSDSLADLVWSDASGGDIEIWFSDGTGVVASAVDGKSPVGAVVSGVDGSDDGEFHQRLCNGDFDGNGQVDLLDLSKFGPCMGLDGSGACEAADMDSDGAVTDQDFELFKASFGGAACSSS